MAPASHLIAGAGLAGLSLACGLLDAGVREPITLVDRRTTFPNDRTWCTWRMPGMRFGTLSRHRWTSWTVRTESGEARSGSSRHPYVQLNADDVYAVALERLRRASNVELRLGERILRLGENETSAWVETVNGRLTADRLYDGLALGSPRVRPILHNADALLWQGFLGQVIEVDRPVFDPGRCVLMDFRVEQGAELRFVYALPYGRHRALVEHTSIGVQALPRQARREALGEYLVERLGVRDWNVEREERGRIPMTDAALLDSRGSRTTAIGVAGGAARPSSGYAFARTVAHTAAVAHAVAVGAAPPVRFEHSRLRMLDRVFLRALADDPGAFPEHLRALVKATPGDTFARFMTDRSTATDDARIVAALPTAPFTAAALRIGLRASPSRRSTTRLGLRSVLR